MLTLQPSFPAALALLLAIGTAVSGGRAAAQEPTTEQEPRSAQEPTSASQDPDTAAAMHLTATEEAIARYVDEHAEDAIAFLERVVNINSGTMNHAGVREVGRVFGAELDALGFEVRWIDMPAEVNRAGHLFAEVDRGSGPRVLLIGHLDTVFEEDSPFQRFERDGMVATGPGVEDMKGGNVVVLLALRALHSVGALDQARIIVALTGDEEKPGHPLEIARADLIEAGRRSDVALGFEGGVDGTRTATVARRGSSGTSFIDLQ